jgi:hypothetical protein
MRLECNFEAGSASRLEMVDLRNRIAHHEPIVLRVRTTVTKTGATEPPLAILRNAADRLDSFEERVARVAALATTLAPAAQPTSAAFRKQSTRCSLPCELQS